MGLIHCVNPWKNQVRKNIYMISASNVYREIFRLFFFFALFTFVVSKFKTGWILMSHNIRISVFKHNCVWANSRRGKTVCKWRRKKIIRDENNPIYSINSLLPLCPMVIIQWTNPPKFCFNIPLYCVWLEDTFKTEKSTGILHWKQVPWW